MLLENNKRNIEGFLKERTTHSQFYWFFKTQGNYRKKASQWISKLSPGWTIKHFRPTSCWKSMFYLAASLNFAFKWFSIVRCLVNIVCPFSHLLTFRVTNRTMLNKMFDRLAGALIHFFPKASVAYKAYFLLQKTRVFQTKDDHYS